MQTAPFKTLCAMTLVAGVSCLADGPGPRRRRPKTAPGRLRCRRPARPRSRLRHARRQDRKTEKPPTQKAPSPSPPGSAPASEDGPDTTENPDPSSCSTASTNSALYNADTASNTMCESSRGRGGWERAPQCDGPCLAARPLPPPGLPRKGETLRRVARPDRMEDNIPAPRPLEVVKHRVHGRRCGRCGMVTRAGFPVCVSVPAQ